MFEKSYFLHLQQVDRQSIRNKNCSNKLMFVCLQLCTKQLLNKSINKITYFIVFFTENLQSQNPKNAPAAHP